jgi:hypothetical protein
MQRRQQIMTRGLLDTAQASLLGCELSYQEARDFILQLRDIANEVLHCVRLPENRACFSGWPEYPPEPPRQLAGSDTPTASAAADQRAPAKRKP